MVDTEALREIASGFRKGGFPGAACEMVAAADELDTLRKTVETQAAEIEELKRLNANQKENIISYQEEVERFKPERDALRDELKSVYEDLGIMPQPVAQKTEVEENAEAFAKAWGNSRIDVGCSSAGPVAQDACEVDEEPEPEPEPAPEKPPKIRVTWHPSKDQNVVAHVHEIVFEDDKVVSMEVEFEWRLPWMTEVSGPVVHVFTVEADSTGSLERSRPCGPTP